MKALIFQGFLFFLIVGMPLGMPRARDFAWLFMDLHGYPPFYAS